MAWFNFLSREKKKIGLKMNKANALQLRNSAQATLTELNNLHKTIRAMIKTDDARTILKKTISTLNDGIKELDEHKKKMDELKKDFDIVNEKINVITKLSARLIALPALGAQRDKKEVISLCDVLNGAIIDLSNNLKKLNAEEIESADERVFGKKYDAFANELIVALTALEKAYPRLYIELLEKFLKNTTKLFEDCFDGDHPNFWYGGVTTFSVQISDIRIMLQRITESAKDRLEKLNTLKKLVVNTIKARENLEKYSFSELNNLIGVFESVQDEFRRARGISPISFDQLKIQEAKLAKAISNGENFFKGALTRKNGIITQLKAKFSGRLIELNEFNGLFNEEFFTCLEEMNLLMEAFKSCADNPYSVSGGKKSINSIINHSAGIVVLDMSVFDAAWTERAVKISDIKTKLVELNSKKTNITNLKELAETTF